MLGDRTITSYSTSEAAQFCDWRLDKDLHCKRLLFDINHATKNSINLRLHTRIGLSSLDLHVFLSVISPLAFVVFRGAWFINWWERFGCYTDRHKSWMVIFCKQFKRCDKPTHTALLSLDTEARLWEPELRSRNNLPIGCVGEGVSGGF